MTTHAHLREHTPVAADERASVIRALVSWAGLGAVGLAAVLVFWVFEALPFQDLPAHAGLIAMRARFPSSPIENDYFVFAPHLGPYSLFRVLGEAFARPLGPIGAVRVLASLPAIATPAALLFARRKLHGDKTLTAGYLGVALSFGLMTLFGFASYLLGLAILLFSLTLWLDMLAAVDRGESTRKREIAIALVTVLVFVAHGHAFVLFVGLAIVSALACGFRAQRVIRLRTLLPATALAAWAALRELGTGAPPGAVLAPAATELRFQGPLDKLSLLATPTLMTRTGLDVAMGLVLWALAIGGAIATVRGLKATVKDDSRAHARALLVCAACVFAAFVALPHAVGWFGFVDGRLVPLLLFLPFMAMRRADLWPWLRAALDRCAGPITAGLAVLALVASYRFQNEARGYTRVLGAVPEGARLLNLPLDPDSDVFTAHPFIHYDKLALAARPIVASDLWFHQGTAIYPRPANPVLYLPPSYVPSDMHTVDWNAYELRDWDFVLVRTRPDAGEPDVPACLSLAEHQGGWWLYRRSL